MNPANEIKAEAERRCMSYWALVNLKHPGYVQYRKHVPRSEHVTVKMPKPFNSFPLNLFRY